MGNNKLPQIGELYSDSPNSKTEVHIREILNIEAQNLEGGPHSRDTPTLLGVKYLHDLLDRRTPNALSMRDLISLDTYSKRRNRSPLTTYRHQANDNTEYT